MAWQKINHSCGHSSELQLYGPQHGRDNEAARRAKSLCPACAKTQWIASRKGLAPNALVRRIPPAKVAPGWHRVEIIAYGNTFPRKDELKERGYRFGEFELRSDIFALLGAVRLVTGAAEIRFHGTKGWAKIIAAKDSSDVAGTALVADFKSEICWLGAAGFQIIERNIRTDPFYVCAASLCEGRADLA